MKLVMILIGFGALIFIALAIWDRKKHQKLPVVEDRNVENRKVENRNVENIPEGNSLIHYSAYVMSNKEKIISILLLGIPMFLIGLIFFSHWGIAAVLSLVGWISPKIRIKGLIERRKNQLTLQFKQAMGCLASSLSAGRSIESAFNDTYTDLCLLYPDATSHIRVEFQIIIRRLQNGEAIETAVSDFANRSGIEDAMRFAEAFATVKRTGGNLIEVMKRTSHIISEKLEIEQDIQVLMSQKKFESRILSISPIVIVGVLAWSSPEYMDPLYQGIGIVIMFCSLLLLGLCYWWTQRIMNIKM